MEQACRMLKQNRTIGRLMLDEKGQVILHSARLVGEASWPSYLFQYRQVMGLNPTTRLMRTLLLLFRITSAFI